jgi:hypothetical protein
MNRFVVILIAMTLTGATAFAQPGPQDGNGPPDGGQRQRGGGGGGPPGMGNVPGMSGPGMDGPRRGGPDGMGPGGPDGGPPMGPMRQFEIMRTYLDIVDHYAKVSSDPTTAGIAAVISAAEVLKPRGPDAAIEYFNKILPEVKNESVARAIREQLAELYKAAGQQDKSLDQLHTLITGAPAESDKK